MIRDFTLRTISNKLDELIPSSRMQTILIREAEIAYKDGSRKLIHFLNTLKLSNVQHETNKGAELIWRIVLQHHRKELVLWKENKIDKEYTINFDELLKKFQSSSFFNDVKKGNYALEYALRLYISSHLNSSIDNELFYLFYEETREALTQKL